MAEHKSDAKSDPKAEAEKKAKAEQEQHDRKTKAEQDKGERERREHGHENRADPYDDRISRDANFDYETVINQNIYKVGFLPPIKNSLTLGEMYIELGDHGARLWVGIQNTADVSSNIERIEEGTPGHGPEDRERPQPNPNPIVLSGSAAEARDPPRPETPADALPTPQQHLPAQYQEGDPNNPDANKRGAQPQDYTPGVHPAHRDAMRPDRK